MMFYSGNLVDTLQMKIADINIQDIAHALACINRFGGHLVQPVSVAQHSVYVSYLCPKEPLQGLLHDASEAYLGDIPGPLKQSVVFERYRKLESRIQLLVYKKFGCQLQEAAEVRDADQLMLRFEAWRGYKKPFWCEAPTALEETRIRAIVSAWVSWDWQRAEEMFIQRFNEITRSQEVSK
jgi:5'-deoxynucleotidase YfbR-like HD superfamily hydrolase